METSNPELTELLGKYLKQENVSTESLSFYVFDSLDSTMNAAKIIIKESLLPAQGALVVALKQEAGRGRLGRAWISDRPGLYCTLIAKFDQPLNQLSGFSLFVGCLLVRLCEALGVKVQLKWPNDVLNTEHQKIAGILVEVCRAESGQYVLTGVGLNISGEFPSELKAASLEQKLGKKLDILEVAAKLQKEFLLSYAKFIEQGFEPFRSEWLSKAAFLGSMVEVHSGSGKLAGIMCDISKTGSLLVEVNGSVQEIMVGDVLSV